MDNVAQPAPPAAPTSPAGIPSGAAIPNQAQAASTDLGALFRLDARRAVVVGAGSGIGQAIALGIAAHGAEVVCVDRDLAAAEATTQQAGTGTGWGTMTAYQLDVLDSAAVTRAVEELGAVDVLVVTPAVNVRKRLLNYTGEEFDSVVRLNLRAAFDLMTGFGRGMAQRGRGSIIGCSSIRSLTTEPGQGVYAMTKAGLVMLLRTLAAELGPQGVRVNAIAPGVIDTPLTAPIKANPEWYAAYGAKSVLGRWGRPHELAGAAVYLASDAASYVTGTVLFVDGGWTAIDGRFTPPS
jgi:NAD(P)-dependent dehydrogenase (short-subunit alcohol dehydrogenase family)